MAVVNNNLQLRMANTIFADFPMFSIDHSPRHPQKGDSEGAMMAEKSDKGSAADSRSGRRIVPAQFAMDEVLWAAWMYYEQGQKQDQIAEQLGISRASVFNLLQKARDEGIVKISIDPSRTARAKLSLELCKATGLQECYILPGPTEPGDLYDEIGHLGARVLEARLQDDDTIGVAWGRTVLSLSHHLQSMPRPNVTVAQITGSAAATFDFSPVLCTSTIAERLAARCINLHAPGVVSSAHVKDILIVEPEIRNHFQLLHNCTKTVFGVTQLASETLLVQAEFMRESDLATYRALGAVGFAVGYFFDAAGNIVRSEFDDRHITMGLENLLTVPERICLGAGEEKVHAIAGMLKAKLATILITDEATATQLLALSK